METVRVKNINYPIKIERKNIKKAYIKYLDNVIVVKCPLNYKDKDILNIIANNEEQIYNLIIKINKKTRYSFENGSEIPFYGNIYKIIYSDEILIRNGFMYLDSRNPIESYNLLSKKYGQEFYKNRIKFFLSSYRLPYIVNKIVIRDMKTRYGVCNVREKKISFQTRLALYPLAAIDYIIVHELCHFKVQNHSKDFYNEVSKIMPDYKKREKMLKEIY